MNFAQAIEAKRFMVGNAISEQSNPVQVAVYICEIHINALPLRRDTLLSLRSILQGFVFSYPCRCCLRFLFLLPTHSYQIQFNFRRKGKKIPCKTNCAGIVSSQQFPVFHVLQYAHLPDGDSVQLYQPFAPGKSFVDEYGVDVFHVREANQPVDSGAVADVAFQVGVRFAPCSGSRAEERHVQHAGFTGMDDGCLLRRQLLRDEVLPDGAGVDVANSKAMSKFKTFGPVPSQAKTLRRTKQVKKSVARQIFPKWSRHQSLFDFIGI
jgi:hypothetical protein